MRKTTEAPILTANEMCLAKGVRLSCCVRHRDLEQLCTLARGHHSSILHSAPAVHTGEHVPPHHYRWAIDRRNRNG